MRRRGSGILLHITSLPSEYGVGDLGPFAERFVDFLARAGQSAWQILPLGPTSPAIGNSPYSSFSAFAGNPLLISPEQMVRDGLLEGGFADRFKRPMESHADYVGAEGAKTLMLKHAFGHVKSRLPDMPDFQAFEAEHAAWLHDYALFAAIKASFGGAVWTQWPAHLRDRDPAALRAFAAEHHDLVLFEKFAQQVFFRQWERLKRLANERGVFLIGDAPIYVTFDSADVWANPEFFKLDTDKAPLFVAGVPPDYFSETGQRWGNPVFDWEALKADGYGWWLRRVEHNIELYDLVRIDHFRGFAGYWEIPAEEETAVNGEWVDTPGNGMDFFDALSARFSHLPIIAEDLGVITPDVRELRDAFGLPGMKIVQFSFGWGIGANHDAVHNHVENCVAYTGTHDNNTARGWFIEETSPEDRARIAAYLGHPVDETTIAPALIRATMGSVAKLAVFPMQDFLGLGPESRMNKPSVADGNWRWRVTAEQLSDDLARSLRELSGLFGRA